MKWKIPILVAIALPALLVLFAYLSPEPKKGGEGDLYYNLIFILNFTTLLIPAIIGSIIENFTNYDFTEKLILIFGLLEFSVFGFGIGMLFQELFDKKKK